VETWQLQLSSISTRCMRPFAANTCKVICSDGADTPTAPILGKRLSGMFLEPLSQELRNLYEIHEWRNPYAILRSVHPKEWQELEEVLTDFRLKHSYINVGGGAFWDGESAERHDKRARSSI